ncbi:AAA family ATPase [Kitasatospora sp. NPDC093102]|uniref:helix-turn-helix transcriptional regulator n=1 Tax=Kitasatospora sp. NPDC093102 TaxID=3155069 RepID=UPI003421106E
MTHFVGRTHELTFLREAAGQARQGKPCTVVVEGEPGIGKSALVGRFAPELDGFTVLRAFGDSDSTEQPYGILQQFLAGVDEELLRRFPTLREPDGISAPPAAVGAQLVSLIGLLEAQRPLVSVIDDWQWADLLSLRALSFANQRLWADSVLAVRITRPDVDPARRRLLDGDGRARHLRLGALTPDEVTELALSLAPQARNHSGFALELHRRTQGHPLYLRTLLNENPVEALTGPADQAVVPASLRSAITSQLAGLPDATRSLLQALAVLATRARLAQVAQLAGLSDGVAALSPALSAGLVDWWPNDPTTPVAFRHELQREAVYSTTDPAHRQRLHAAAAPMLPRSASWRHRMAASAGFDAGLAAELEQEAAAEAERGRLELCATYLRWGSQLCPERDDRERMLLMAAVRLASGGRTGEVVAMMDTIADCSPSRLRTCALGSAYLFRGEGPRGIALLEQVLAETEPGHEDFVASLAATLMSGMLTWLGRGGEAVRMAERALAAPDAPSEIVTVAGYSRAAGTVHQLGAARGVERLLDLLPGTDTGELARIPLGAALRTVGRLTAAATTLESTATRIESGLNHFGVMLPHGYLAHTYVLLGRHQEAAPVIERGLALARERDQAVQYSGLHSAAAMIAAARGDWRTAEEEAALARRWCAALGNHEAQAVAAGTATAAVAHARGDAAGVLEALGPLRGRPAPPGRALNNELLWKPWLVEALIDTGDLDAAGAELSLLEQDLTATPALRPWLTGLAAALAEARGETAEAAHRYEQALSHPTGSDDQPLERALLEWRYGRLLATTGRHTESFARLDRARQRLAGLGAAAYLARLGRPEPQPGPAAAPKPSGAGSATAQPTAAGLLTDRERQIAEQVARGLSNAEVAHRLFITVKTVEYHLGRTYTKLGLANRRQLRDLMMPAR